MRRTQLATVLAVTVVALAPAACAPDGASITAPAATSVPQGPRLGKAEDAAFDADGDGRLNDAEKDAKDAAKAADKRAFEALRDQWRAYKDSVKAGLVDVEFARCEPLPTAGETRRIGPKGGEIRMGRHTLVIPAGALATEVEITGTAPTGSLREVQFAPHGLVFATPVRLTLSVDKCLLPAASTAEIVYTALGHKVIEREPSHHDRDTKLVEGWTDHFSGYVVAYGRR